MRVTNQRAPVSGERDRVDTLHPVGFYEVPERFQEPALIYEAGSLVNVPDPALVPSSPSGSAVEIGWFGLLNSELLGPLQEYAGDPAGLLAMAADLYDRGELERAFALAETVATGRSGYAFLQGGGISEEGLAERARRGRSLRY